MIEVRQLTKRDEFNEAVRLQKVIWGFADIDLLPVRLFVVSSKVGGHVFGAFEDGRMVGFCVAIPGLRPGGAYYLHSHMLGVLESHRDRGVGRMLKLAQRSEALSRGIRLMEWTFDPLELKNAYFNLEKLGAIVRRYVLNQYGSSSSALHGSLPTDRCVAEWLLDSKRVRDCVDGKPRQRPEIRQRIEVPLAVEHLRHADPGQARKIQSRISDQFETFLARDLIVVGMDRTDSIASYLLADAAHVPLT